ncbi:hypothetical protein [Shewanella algae]
MAESSKAAIIITFAQQEDGRLEIACKCSDGGSEFLNEAARHVASKIPMNVNNALIDYLKKQKKEKKHDRNH